MNTIGQLAKNALKEQEISSLIRTFATIALETLPRCMPVTQVTTHPIQVQVLKIAAFLGISPFDKADGLLVQECKADEEFRHGHFTNTVNFLGQHKSKCGLDVLAWANSEITRGIVRELIWICEVNHPEAFSIALEKCTSLVENTEK